MSKIEWTSSGGFQQGYAVTKTGLRAMITQVQRSTGVKPLYSLYIEGDKKNAVTRATLEKINEILESR